MFEILEAIAPDKPIVRGNWQMTGNELTVKYKDQGNGNLIEAIITVTFTGNEMVQIRKDNKTHTTFKRLKE